MHDTSTTRFSVATALLLVAVAIIYRLFFMGAGSLFSEKTIPLVGKEGSAHAHASMLIMVEGKKENFCMPKYMLQSGLVHFEDNNCVVVHRHATGVTFPFFFTTIGVKVTDGCIQVPSGRYCNQGNKKVSAVLNRKVIPVSDLAYLEIGNNDHLLINYGDESGSQLLFTYNQVPAVPKDINPPKELRVLKKMEENVAPEPAIKNSDSIPI